MIVPYPNKILRARTTEVLVVDRSLKKGIADLTAMLKRSENGAGLAATQIGLEGRFFGVKEPESGEVRVVINPEIEMVWGGRVFPKLIKEDNSEENFLEGCLSFPNYYGMVKRYLKIKASWEEVKVSKLVKISKILSGFEAIVFQHESDHLDGILFVDHVKEDGGKFYKWDKEKMVEIDIKTII